MNSIRGLSWTSGLEREELKCASSTEATFDRGMEEVDKPEKICQVNAGDCIGLRVVRGPSWKSGDEDGGEGGIGTVISEANEADATVSVSEKLDACSLEGDNDIDMFKDEEKKYVSVIWDCTGLKGIYSVSTPLHGSELRVLNKYWYLFYYYFFLN